MSVYRNILFLFFIALVSAGLRAQNNMEISLAESGEDIRLFTDREMYVIGEDIYFSADYTSPKLRNDRPLSTVLYLELLNCNGDKFQQGKFSITEGLVEGHMAIGKTIKSGVYYLRAYTKWMRNFSPEEYTYLPIKIVNPYSKEILQKRKNQCNFNKQILVADKEILEDISIDGLEDHYGRRAHVGLDVHIPREFIGAKYRLSVVSSGSISDTLDKLNIAKEHVIGDKTLRYFPEIRGLSLSGRLVAKSTKEAIPNVELYLSTISSSEYISQSTSDDDGSFMFSLLPNSNRNEYAVILGDTIKEEVEFLIDSEFCNRKVSLPHIPFRLSEKDNEVLLCMGRNVQLSEKYSGKNKEVEKKHKELAFYGEPSRVLYEKDFIELENIREFVYELVYEVKAKKVNGGEELFSTQQTVFANFPVLVLMDNIPIYDIEALLKVKCRKIERIEIISEGYCVGEKKYGAVMSVFSEKGDLAGLSFGENTIYFEMDHFSNGRFEMPDYLSEEGDALLQPDRRNTLYWNTLDCTAEKEKFSIDFYTGDASGAYQIWIKGYNESGEYVSYSGPVFHVD